MLYGVYLPILLLSTSCPTTDDDDDDDGVIIFVYSGARHLNQQVTPGGVRNARAKTLIIHLLLHGRIYVYFVNVVFYYCRYRHTCAVRYRTRQYRTYVSVSYCVKGYIHTAADTLWKFFFYAIISLVAT